VRPVLVCLHALGSSAREFDALTAALGDDVEVLAIDLPGFGGAASEPPADVAGTADRVVARIAEREPERWFLLGHSMGGKVASVVAARAAGGDDTLAGLVGVVLLAGSPPSPEPMDEDRRARMLAWADPGPLSPGAARAFVDANVGGPLPPAHDAEAVVDVRRSSPAAWTAWLESGSREDWSDRVGPLDLPALVVAGGEDGDLGPDAQARVHGPVYPRARFVTLDGAGHLLPRERPDEVAALVRELVGSADRAP